MMILTERAQIQAHEATNRIIIQDIPARVEQAEQIIRALDRPPLQVLVQAEIVDAKIGTQLEVGVDYEFDWGDSRLGEATGVVAPEDLLIQFVNGNLTAADSTELFGVDFRFVLNLAESKGFIKKISSPFGRVRNHEAFDFQDGSEEPFKVNVSTYYDNATTPRYTESQRSRSVGRILSSAGYIQLDVSVEDSFARPGEISPDLLAVDQKTVTTIVDVKDGHTVALGGVIEESDQTTYSGIPIIMHIPYLGRLFRNEDRISGKRKAFIFITPTILEVEDPYELAERYRLGQEFAGADTQNIFDWSHELPGEEDFEEEFSTMEFLETDQTQTIEGYDELPPEILEQVLKEEQEREEREAQDLIEGVQ
jgi:type II secretory pathway component GspD/PulD (secretin)